MKKLKIILIALVALNSSAQAQRPAYLSYTSEDGLPSNYVYTIYQDSKGFIWFGTDAGVSKYNGYTFQNFSMEDGLADNDVFYILEDSKGRMWFATYNGKLCYFKDGVFHSSANTKSLAGHDFSSFISCLYEDVDGNVWFGSRMSGIKYLNDKNKFHTVEESTFYQKRNSTWGFHDIWQNGSGDIMALTDHTLENVTKKETVLLKESGIDRTFRFTHHLKKIQLGDSLLLTENGNFHVLHKNQRVLTRTFESLNSSVVFIDQDVENNIWAATLDGMYKISPDFNNIISIPFLKNSRVSSRRKDNQGNTWYSTLDKGVFMVPKTDVINYTLGAGLPEKEVFKVTGNSNGKIMIGQRNYYSFIENQRIESINENPLSKLFKGERNSTDPFINDVFLDDQGRYIVSSDNGAIVQLENDRYYLGKGSNSSIICTDQSILFGSRYLMQINENELAKLASNEYRTLDSYSKDLNKKYRKRELRDTLITKIYQDKGSSKIWTGLGNGLKMMDDGVFTDLSFVHPTLNGRITDIISYSEDGGVWVASYGQGIVALDKEGELMQHISTANDLSSNLCNALALDSEGALWIGTEDGLSKMVRHGDQYFFTRYTVNDGLLSNRINDLYIHKKKIWIASDEGLSIMEINKETAYAMPVHITASSVNGNEIILHDKKRFFYDQNNLSLEFVAIDYRMRDEISYRYRIRQDQEWNYTENNKLNFSSLAGGNYSLEIQAKNKQGIWAKEITKISFSIATPPWLSWWAYASYISLACFIVYGLVRYEFRRKLLQSELVFQKRESKKVKELEKLKSQFFSNVSHEFRTPLTLILGPLDRIIRDLDNSELKRQLSIINRNATSLLHLINQLLDISKLESGKLTLQPETKDIIKQVESVCEKFALLAQEEEIDFEVKNECHELFFQYDPGKVDIILNNLLINSIKFTPKGGCIRVKTSLNTSKDRFIIQVMDTGIGIKESEIAYVFDRFYQADATESREYEGTGIGLSLAKELVELHGGTISVQSKKGVETTFTLEIPKINGDAIPAVVNDDLTMKPAIRLPNGPVERPSQHSILIVEDNPEMCEYVQDILNVNYKTNIAGNGEEGISLAKEMLPDLIVSDVMMPYMSGIELCARLKDDIVTSHIPIVLLTAKARVESKVEGFEIGADGYITKPFNALELNAQVKNLIRQREKLREKFSQKAEVITGDLVATSVDKMFLQKAIDIVDANISDAHFDVTSFTKEIGMSRTQLHTKLKALTNQSASEFIRAIRLKKAAQLLKGGVGNVSQISHQVGFQTRSYFTASFKKMYGVSPQEYKKTN